MSLQVTDFSRFQLPHDLREVLSGSPRVLMPKDREELYALSFGVRENDHYEVSYYVPGRGRVVEATVAKCTNGLVVNYTDPYMRRRDPNCTLVGDDLPTDKETYKERYGQDFSQTRRDTFEWLKGCDLVVVFFKAGGPQMGYPAILVAPANAAFFALSLADLQGMISPEDIDETFVPRAVLYVAPPFRHTRFDGGQVVVHHRSSDLHEIFAYNLYPGPSAKKGVYGVLLTIGEAEGWLTAHAATVQLTTPYDNILTIMHEGASGSGKSEMLEEIHRRPDGRIHFGTNVVTGESLIFALGDTCALTRITDDMAICHPSQQTDDRKLMVSDAESGWFFRIDHVTEYGTAPMYEKLTIHPQEPLVFLNLKGVAGSTCLIWDHTEDAPGVRCPNPRVIVPRSMVPGTGDGPVAVDVRSFGVRTPPCTKELPSYGILGVLHILPAGLGWLWRLVAPRGHANPSILSGEGMESEGVGSFWPFATGSKVELANILLRQILGAPATRFTLSPNQHIGAWKVGFMPQWIGREFLARRGGAKLRQDQTVPSRCPLLGHALDFLRVDGNEIPKGLLHVNLQSEVGNEAYDAGADLLQDFFDSELEQYLQPDLEPIGRRLIECCLNRGSVDDYQAIMPK